MPGKKKGGKPDPKPHKRKNKAAAASGQPPSATDTTTTTATSGDGGDTLPAPAAPEDLHCAVCGVTLGSPEGYLEHVNGKKHKKQVEAHEAAKSRPPPQPDAMALPPCLQGWARKSTKCLDDPARMRLAPRWMEIRGPYLAYSFAEGTPHKGVIHLAGTAVRRSFQLPDCYEGADDASECHSAPPTPLQQTPLGMTPMHSCEGISPHLYGGSSPGMGLPDFQLGESYAERMGHLVLGREGSDLHGHHSHHSHHPGLHHLPGSGRSFGHGVGVIGGGGGGGVSPGLSAGSPGKVSAVHAPEYTLELSGGGLARDLFLVFGTEEGMLEWRSALSRSIAKAEDAEREEDEEDILHRDEVLFDEAEEHTGEKQPNGGGGGAAALSPTYRKPQLSDFELLTTIGRGSFGKVIKVKRRTTGEVYAMKVLAKEAVIRDNIVDKVHGERNSLAGVHHPFLSSLQFAFQTPDRLYLIMLYYPGGDLRFHLRSRTKFPQPMAMFYAGQLTLALEYLHGKSILYRDLKPGNVVLGADGYAVLTDFGMAKRAKRRRTTSFCGTDTYMAPEVIAEKLYDDSVDWWSLGIVIYEMLVGHPPFNSDEPTELYDMIQETPVKYPAGLSDAASSIMHGFLTKDVKSRLRIPKRIKAHPFFSDLDWGKLFAKELPPPFKPNLDKSDTRYFDARFTNERPAITRCHGAIGSNQQEGFAGFSYPRLSCS